MAENAPIVVDPAPDRNQPDSSSSVAYNIQQVTQFNTAIPSHVWTPDVIKDLHAKQHDIEVRKQNGYVLYRQQEFRQGLIGLALISAIVGVGLYLLMKGDPTGKDIVGSTVLFLAGYLAGKGKRRLGYTRKAVLWGTFAGTP